MTKSKSSSYILTQLTPVILSSSKDRVLIEDNLRRIPSHFDKACPELAEGLSVTKENVKK